MGTIAQKLTYLEDTKTAIGNAIAAKGGSVTGKTFRQYATEISNLPSGGGGTPILESVDVSDYTGGTSFNPKEQLTGVNLPNSVTSIRARAFESFTGLISITIPNNVTMIDSYAFQYCTGLTSVAIPNSVTSIGSNVFADCSGLTSITIGTGLTSIGSGIFFRCTGLTSVAIPNNVTTISGSAFGSCTGLTYVTIGSGVTSIGAWAFDGCSSLTSITIEATTPPTLGNGAFNNTNNCPIYVPAESVDAYKAASGWSDLSSRIQAISA